MIDQQYELELGMINRGNSRYWRQQENAVEQGRGDETSYSKRLLPDLVVKTAAELAERLEKRGRGARAPEKKALDNIDPAAAALVAMRCILQAVTKPTSATAAALLIGRRIEDEMRLQKFESEHTTYFKKVQEDFKRKNTTDYRHRHRVMVKMMNDHEVEWHKWSKELHVRVGAIMLQCAIDGTKCVRMDKDRKGKKLINILVPTTELLQWIQDHMEQMEMMNPDLGPCVVTPRDWKGIKEGGYYVQEIADRVPFVKSRDRVGRKRIKDADLSVHMAGVNAIQRTPWIINAPVLKAMQAIYSTGNHPALPRKEPFDFPTCPVRDTAKEDFTEEQALIWKQWCRDTSQLHTMERERVGKNIQFLRVMQQARTYAGYDEMYFVYQCDFRGRVYATSTGISPQGADFNKSLIKFKRGEQLGADGWFWLRVHGANLFGHDKVSYADRVSYIDSLHDQILYCAADPASAELWTSADKPWQFLAFCNEYANAKAQGSPETFTSHLPVGLDGSCNGLQNFSAMLRDSVGGTATNLISSLVPSDIYQEVANVVIARVRESDEELAAQWLKFGITRKCTKTPVMTLPYGSTQMTCTDSILDYIRDNQDKAVHWPDMTSRMKAAIWLSKIVWSSIGKVVIAARAAMKWLQDASRVVTKAGHPLEWVTPTGFLVYQANKRTQYNEIRLRLMKGCSVQSAYSFHSQTDKLCSRRQANGSAPNFVHGNDASHMILTINDAHSKGIEDFAMIHDDYGTHACNVPVLHKSIRSAFVKMYTDHDVLQEFKDRHEALGVELPDLPPKGDLDINEVLSAEYFFG